MDLTQHIGAHTSQAEAIERRELAALARVNKSIKKAANNDRVQWVEDTLQESEWAPVRALSKPRAPRVVALQRAEGYSSAQEAPAAVQHPKPAE
eukprot:7865914-Alexandrium_andersonii.AAC.1